MIGKFAALIVITIVTDGIGDVVLAGAEGWGLSAGAASVVAGGAEAAVFTTLNQIFIDEDHSFGHIVFDFAANWAMFGMMRRFAAFAKAAELSKFTAVTGQTVLMVGTTLARAELEKEIKDGRNLNKEELKQLAIQGIIMAIALHAISPKLKPLFTDLENASFTWATKLRLNNKTLPSLQAHAEALNGAKDLKVAQDYVATEKAWVEERLALLDRSAHRPRRRSRGPRTASRPG